jgi:hypothetical protein
VRSGGAERVRELQGASNAAAARSASQRASIQRAAALRVVRHATLPSRLNRSSMLRTEPACCVAAAAGTAPGCAQFRVLSTSAEHWGAEHWGSGEDPALRNQALSAGADIRRRHSHRASGAAVLARPGSRR